MKTDTLLAFLITGCALAACVDDGSPDTEAAAATTDEAPQRSIAPEGPAPAASCTVTVTEASQLMITDVRVVEDAKRTTWTGSLADPADGAWQFGRLMTEMAGANNPQTFVRSWLAQWERDVTVNQQVVPARPSISTIINAWPKLASGELDLTRAPFRLLAIVNRFDLRQPGDAGEGRFVFGVLDGNGNPLQFTVILEYKQLAADGAAVKAWADRWAALGAETLGTPAYAAALQAITDGFAKGGAGPGRVNGSAISQVRTNEIALAAPWELREFHLNSAGQLRMATLALTPGNQHNGSALLADYVNQNTDAIKAGTHVVPRLFEGVPFAAARATNQIDFWSAPGILDPEARHLFSLNTCNGCHGAETSTGFLQVRPRARGVAAGLAGFLTGIDVTDPVTRATRHFDDLRRRKRDLRAFLCAGG